MGTWTWDGNCSCRPSLTHLRQGLEVTNPEKRFVKRTLWWSYVPFGEGNGNPLQYSCLENPKDGGACWAADHGVMKSRTRLSDFTFTFHFHTLEKEMATHSSVLTWRLPGMGELSGLPPIGSHTVEHD